MEERLQKYLANNGVAARRKCEEFIQEERVKVNGEVVKELGTKINPEKDIVEFDGKVVKPVGKKVYILLNKPIGYVTTVKDQFERPTVLDLVKVEEKVLPVGRLDMYTSGALILSNDGEFINKVTHPRNEVEKTYTVTVKGIVTKEDVEKLQNGVEIQMDKLYENEDENNEENNYNPKQKDKTFKTGKAKVKILKTDEEKNISRLQITIHEGKNREVRKMCEAIGKKVLALHRRKIGNLDVKNIELGKWRYLNKKEVEEMINRWKTIENNSNTRNNRKTKFKECNMYMGRIKYSKRKYKSSKSKRWRLLCSTKNESTYFYKDVQDYFDEDKLMIIESGYEG